MNQEERQVGTRVERIRAWLARQQDTRVGRFSFLMFRRYLEASKNTGAAFIDTPMTTLLHGILSLRDRPEQEKQAWRELFDYYVFDDPGDPAEHLPEHARGILARLDDAAARRLRAELLQRLNR